MRHERHDFKGTCFHVWDEQWRNGERDTFRIIAANLVFLKKESQLDGNSSSSCQSSGTGIDNI